jgi:type IV pilus assembly protein PilY1
MKLSRFLFLVSLLLMALTAQADDIDIYGVSGIGEGLKPNVLIILDNSGSMDENDVPGEPYDPNVTYSGNYETNRVYEKDGKSWDFYFSDIDSANWTCEPARTQLKTTGSWKGKLRLKKGIVTCTNSGSAHDYRLGNYRNFLASGGAYRIRMEVAKEVVANLIYQNHEKVNFGLMAFNTGGNADNGGYIVAKCGAELQTLIGSYTPGTSVMLDKEQNDFGAVGTLYSTTWTPLSETMAEAGLYFAGKQSWFNGTSTGSSYPLGKYSYSCTQDNDGCQNYNASSPIEFRCQKNYIILVTDGEPTHDDDKLDILNYIINQHLTESGTDGNNSYLDDVAEFLNANDLLPELGSAGDFPDQTVTTYTVGFQTDQDLLESTASRGGGEYYTATSAAELGESLTNIIDTIGQLNEMFTASTVPVSTADGVFSGNHIYLGLFQPTNQSNWLGNLKKFGLSDDGAILDKFGNPAANDKGTIFDSATSYWCTAADGPNVAAGGAGELLRDRATERVLYTYTGSNSALNHSSNMFTATNTVLTAATDADPPGLGLSLDDINAVHRGVAEDWPLGSLLHFQPLVEHYDIDNDGAYDGSGDKSVIFVGGNDGLLHCFDDSTGEELWGFIPPDLLSNINLLSSADDLLYFVDGNASLYHYDDDGSANTPDKKLLIFGQRRGGFSYTTLDVTNHSAPLYKYSIDADHLGSGQEVLGQSWAEPQPCRMGYMDNSTYKTKDVFFLSGGYDINQDKEGEEKATEDSIGRAVFAIDAQTGALFSNCLFSHSNYASMTHSIIDAAAYPSPYTGTSTRIYAGDLNGNLFAFRDDIFHRNRDASKSADFEGKYDGQEDGNWEQKLKLYSAPGKKIWYAPEITYEYYPVNFTYPANETGGSSEEIRTEYRVGDFVFFGTGDRSRPNETGTVNVFYAIKNNWQWPDNSPTIIEAYVDKNDNGTVKAKSDNHIITDEEYFILDVTDNRIHDQQVDEQVRIDFNNFVKTALKKPNNRGWFLRLIEKNGSSVGEKLVSSPLIFSGIVLFTTFVPESNADGSCDAGNDPCASPGSSGTGYLYALDYLTGADAFNLVEERRLPLAKSGIPPAPTLIVTEEGPIVLVGTQGPSDDDDEDDDIDPWPDLKKNVVERFFWRQLNLN